MKLCPNCQMPVAAATGTRARVWCSDRCRKAAGRRGIKPNGRRPEEVDVRPVPAKVSLAVDEFLARLEYPPEDPRWVVGEVARALAAEMDRAPAAMIAKELRSHLEHLGGFPNDAPGVVDEIRARRAQRRVELLLSPPPSDQGGVAW